MLIFMLLQMGMALFLMKLMALHIQIIIQVKDTITTGSILRTNTVEVLLMLVHHAIIKAKEEEVVADQVRHLLLQQVYLPKLVDLKYISPGIVFLMLLVM